MNPARQAAVHAGLPVTVPALTVNRVCGSGAQAIVSVAQDISLGNINVAVAGGMENMDQAPYLIARGRWGYRMGDGALYHSVLRDGLNDAFSDEHSGWHTRFGHGACGRRVGRETWPCPGGTPGLLRHRCGRAWHGRIGPVPAVKQAFQRAGWDIRSIERAEINEAFAAIAIVVTRELGLPEDIVNVEGGAVAHGHPIGATGAVLTTKLIHWMRRDGLTRGLVTLCIGGGQGIALAIEALH
jgi:acetyl-CoA acetyltransferase